MTAARLPEPLPTADRILILATDCAAVALVGTVAAIKYDEPAVASALAPATFLAVGAAAGAFAQSLALRARDELYYSLAIGLIAAPIALGVAGYFHRSPRFAGLAVAAVTLADAACRTLATSARRRGAAIGACAAVDGKGYGRARSTARRTLMRALDLGLAIAGTIAFAPVALVTAAVVYASCGRPIIFAQRRVGRDGRPFTMFKFRTMRTDAGDAWARPGDDRLTPVGAFLRRTSLDELPQLLNVLRGEMSLVGPRPEMCEYAQRFERDVPHYSQRHLVRPGITGWAQLHLPRTVQPHDMRLVAAYDNFYVQNNGIVLYVFAIVKTIAEVLTHRAV
jgi:lipopolysaccharide/colanic/teichoic acid biosynthesis glycosyltransferase